jgi:hypothetical protein
MTRIFSHFLSPGLGRRLTVVAAATCAVSAFGTSASAQAALISTAACNATALSTPFAAWGDTSDYELAPGGNFESGLTGWTLSGGAGLVAGSEPYDATGTPGSSSLLLPAGASAQSPFTCVNAAYPTLRFFARNNGLASSVLVQVVYRTALGVQVVLPVGTVALSGSWEPTLPMLTASAVPAALSGGTAEVALRFTALLGPSQIDDVYVDPRCA